MLQRNGYRGVDDMRVWQTQQPMGGSRTPLAGWVVATLDLTRLYFSWFLIVSREVDEESWWIEVNCIHLKSKVD